MIKAKKKFGQNFLKDGSILTKIIESIPNNSLEIVEIGPGLGDLTQKLLELKRELVAFEVDLDLCNFLQDKFKQELSEDRLHIICGDVLQEWGEGSLRESDYNLVANLPYYIATNIILKALKDTNCKNITVMVQKEVAEKFAAKSGEKNFSSLSILAKSICDVEILFDVDANSFEPVPKVKSSVINFNKFSEYIENGSYEAIFSSVDRFKKFEKFLKVAFIAPRKVLRKNLSQLYKKENIDKSFEEIKISTKIRPHELSIENFHLLFNILNK